MCDKLTNKRLGHLDVATLLFNVTGDAEQIRLRRQGEDQFPHSFASRLCATHIEMRREGGLYIFDIQPSRIGHRRLEPFAQPGEPHAGIDGFLDAVEAPCTHLSGKPLRSL